MRKTVRILLCGLMAAAVLGGCGKKDTSETTAASGKTTAEIKLGEYKGVTYTPVSTEVTEEDVDAEIEALLASNPAWEEVDRPAAEGDTVNIDYVGMKDGVAFDGGTAEGQDLTLGSGRFIDGFEDGLIGAAKGQEVSLNLTFPDPYENNPDLAGAAVVFDVTVNAVKVSKDAEWNDEFVQANTEYETVDEFRKGTLEDLKAMAEANAEYYKKAQVIQKVVENSEATLPEDEVQAYYDEQYAMYESQASMFGMDLKTMLGYSGTTLEDFEAQLMESSKEGVKMTLVTKEIGRLENIEVTDEERQELCDSIGYASVEEMIESEGQDQVDEYLLMEKVVDFLAENAVAEEPAETTAAETAPESSEAETTAAETAAAAN